MGQVWGDEAQGRRPLACEPPSQSLITFKERESQGPNALASIVWGKMVLSLI